eukprot:jgi/Mesvir1/28480/Mv15900-RA.1
MRTALLAARRAVVRRAIAGASSPALQNSLGCSVYGQSPVVPFSAGAVEGLFSPSSPAHLFPREGAGVNYTLNWALVQTGVAPAGLVHRNLKANVLVSDHGAVAEQAASNDAFPVFAHGATSAGAATIKKGKFGKLLKDVSAHLSSRPSLYLHDGAVGSAPATSAPVRGITDAPSAALALQGVLTPAPLTKVAASAFPVTLYAAQAMSPSAAEAYGLPASASKGFVALDVERRAVVVVGNVPMGSAAVQDALAAVTSPIIMAKGGLPLHASYVPAADHKSGALVLAPRGVVSSSPATGIIWSPAGVSRMLGGRAAEGVPNLLNHPAAVILVTNDASKALPSSLKLTLSQAAYSYLVGFDGASCVPCYSKGPASVAPLEATKKFLDLLNTHKPNCFLVNAAAEPDLAGAIAGALSGKLLKSRKPSLEKISALADLLNKHVSTTHSRPVRLKTHALIKQAVSGPTV